MRLAVTLPLLMVSNFGCGEIDGSQAFAGVAEYAPADGAYRMRFLSPPWLLLHTSGEKADLAVAPSELSADILHATVTLHVEPVMPAAQQAAAAALAAWTDAHPQAQVNAPLAPVANMASQLGYEFAGFDPPSLGYHREAFFDGANATFGLRFDGIVRLDSRDVSDVVAGFVPRGNP